MSITAEIGQNFMGKTHLAFHMIDLARQNGASWVKFQLYDSVKLYGRKQDTELSRPVAFSLFDYAKSIGMPCYFSVFDQERVQWCEDIGVKAYKIAFNQRFNDRLIDCIKETGKRIVVSSDEFLPHLDPDNVQYLYCIPKYPAEERDLHYLKSKMTDPRWKGFSDHFIGNNVSKIALSLGAWQIEKHFAIDHQTGIDAPWSMTPIELKDLWDFERKLQTICR